MRTSWTGSSAVSSPMRTSGSTQLSSSVSGRASRRNGRGASSAASHWRTCRRSPICSPTARSSLPRMGIGTLVLLRHGESEWNAANLFTGWVDVGLTERGLGEAVRAGELLAENDVLPDVVHTSVLKRAIATAGNALGTCDRQWIQVRRTWRLNERHYGDLQGKDKSQVREKYGDEQFMVWRRSYDTPPPPLADDSEWSQAGDPRYAALAPEIVPRTECLKDVVGRLLPYWDDAVVPDFGEGGTRLVAANGNSLRAMVKHLDDVSDEDIPGLNIPTGIPLRYDLDDNLRPRHRGGQYLDPEAAKDAIEAVKNQGR